MSSTSTASSFFSAYASFAGSMMLVRSMVNQFSILIPTPLRSYLFSTFHHLFNPLTNNLSLIIDERCGMTMNQVYEAAEIYLQTKINPNTQRLCLRKTPRQKSITVTIGKNELVTDWFENIELKWRLVCEEPRKSQNRGRYPQEKRSFELTFHKKFEDTILSHYIPFVLAKANELKEKNRVVKLYSRDCPFDPEDGGGEWGSVNLEHPATFETLAMDPVFKKSIIDDLDRFVRRKDFYKRVGKAWNRGYLLYGPHGTGKTSLVAAMANYLKFDIYDLELASIYSNSDLRRIPMSTTDRSILVIEDIDCSLQMQNRQDFSLPGLPHQSESDTKLTLSGVLNFIDGLCSSCGDERIIVLTTNHKDKLDPALLQPGRMDMHINMSYCCVQGFNVLASNYLGLEEDCTSNLYKEARGLIENSHVTPAEVAEELMKSDDSNVALEGLVRFLKHKRAEETETKGKNEVGFENENGSLDRNIKEQGEEKRTKHVGGINVNTFCRNMTRGYRGRGGQPGGRVRLRARSLAIGINPFISVQTDRRMIPIRFASFFRRPFQCLPKP